MLPEVRVARIVEAIGRYGSGRLSCLEAAEVLGMSERSLSPASGSLPRLRGAESLIDRRRGRASGRRAPVDQIEWLLEQYRTRYWDFTTKHFHEHLVCDHGFAYGYTWTKLQLQRAGLVKPAKRRGVHRRRAAQAAASRHAGVPGRLALPLACGVGPRAGPGGEHGRCHERGLFGLSGGGGKHALELPGAPGDDRGEGSVLQLLHRPGKPLLRDAEGRRQGRQGSGRRRSGGRSRSSASSTSPPIRHRPGGGSSGSSARSRTVCRKSSDWPGSATSRRPTATSARSSCRPSTPNSPCRQPSQAPPSSPTSGPSSPTSFQSRKPVRSRTTSPCAITGCSCRSPNSPTAGTSSRPASASMNIPTARSLSSTAPDASDATISRATSKPTSQAYGPPKSARRPSLWISGKPLRAFPLPHRPNNSSGHLMCYLIRTSLRVIDIRVSRRLPNARTQATARALFGRP